ncbi:MAG: amino acid permease [Desulfobacterales bacterium]
MNENPSGKTEELKKTLRPVDAVMIVVGNVIGVGIFTTTGFIAGDLPDAYLIMAVWALGGVLTLFGALTYGELGAMFPRAGGDYIYLKEAYGPLAGFMVGWVGFFIINPGSMAALALGLTEYLLPLITGGASGFSPVIQKLIAVLMVLLFTCINYVSVQWSSRAQNLLSGFNLLTIVIIVSAGFIFGSGSWENFDYRSDTSSVSDLFGPAMVSVFFTYSGWFVSAYVASEIKNPQKALPMSLIISSLVVTVVYIAMNVFYIYALSIPSMDGVVDIARRASESLLGGRASVLFSIMIVCAILGSLNSVTLTAPRIYYAMAKDGLFPKRLGMVHPRFKTPYYSIAIQAVIACALILAGNFYQLLSYTVFFMLLTCIVTAFGVFFLRFRKPHLNRPYKAWGYPFTTLVFVIAYAWISVRVFLYNPRDALIGIFIVLIGIPFFMYWRKKSAEEPVGIAGIPVIKDLEKP